MPITFPFIIGLAGKAQTGKDTAAAILQTELNAGCYAFADPVTRECAHRLLLTHSYFLSLPKNYKFSNGFTKRTLMQQVGREIRSIDNLEMIKTMHGKLTHQALQHKKFNVAVISDIRTEQEADYVRSNGGLILHIKNKNAPPAPADITEQDLQIMGDDQIIRNHDSLLPFEKKIQTFAHWFKHEHKEQAA